MKFGCFTQRTEMNEALAGEVNRFISKWEDEGMIVVDQQTHLAACGDKSLINPTAMACVWMDYPTDWGEREE